MAVPAHKTEYFIIENSNLQKKANTPLNVNCNLYVRYQKAYCPVRNNFHENL